MWGNPFLLRRAEKINSITDFLHLFDSRVLSILGEDSFSKIHFVRSSPGAGKTTIFKALSPNILSKLINNQSNENYKDFFNLALEKAIIHDNKVTLLSTVISCSKNYDIIDEVFQNGRRQQVFFALLNVRIVINLLKNIMSICMLSNKQDLVRITFTQITETFDIMIPEVNNGLELYNWACKEEGKICTYIDNMSDEKTNFTFNYSTLFCIQLFQPENLLFDGNRFLNHTLVIFDDVQKLTYNQRELLINTAKVNGSNVGIWVGERLEALSDMDVISTDGSIGRDLEIFNLEMYWSKPNHSKQFKKMLSNIADRRVSLSLYSDTISNFESCIRNEINIVSYKENLNASIKFFEDRLILDSRYSYEYSDIVKYCNQEKNLLKKALKWKCLEIIYNRQQRKAQQSLDLNIKYRIENFKKDILDNKVSAEFYVCRKNNIPYYYGINRLQEMSSYNIEQFLSLSGSIFKKSIAKGKLHPRRNKNFEILPHEQEKCLKDSADKSWEDILRKHSQGEEIQNLISNFTFISLEQIELETNSYSGGSYTGFAIDTTDLNLLNNKEYAELSNILSVCVAANYFEKRRVKQDSKDWLVFYLNRWLCVKFGLPLKYGGWKPMQLETMKIYIEKRIMDKKNNDQISFLQN